MSSQNGVEVPSCEDRAEPPSVQIDDKSDYAALLRQHQTQLFGYIYSLVRDLDDADDLFQQTSLVLWDKFDQFDRSKSFINWAFGVARYEVLNFLRSRARRRLYFSDELNLAIVEAHESLEHERLEERRDALAGCMKKLRQQDRELLEDCYQRSATLRDVALRYSRSTHSIHNSLRRIRRSLFTCVQRHVARGGLS